MIKKVQIAGWDDNYNYFDTDGNMYRTMGDFSPSKGQWVWVNGKHIYGHTTGGGASVMTFDSCIPFACSFAYGTVRNSDRYSLYANGYIRLVNDDSHCYAHSTYVSSTDFYDVMTGKIVYHQDTGVPLDAEIAEDGSLLTATSDMDYYYIHSDIPKDLSNYFFDHYYLDGEVKIEFDDAKDFGGTSDSSSASGSLKIYKNDALLSTHDMSVSVVLSDIKSTMESLLREYTNDGTTFPKGRERPSGNYINASAGVYMVRLHRDGSWEGIVTGSAIGICFPYITVERDSWDITTDRKGNKTYDVKSMGTVDVWTPMSINALNEYYVNSKGECTKIFSHHTAVFMSNHINTKKNIGTADNTVKAVKLLGDGYGAKMLFQSETVSGKTYNSYCLTMYNSVIYAVNGTFYGANHLGMYTYPIYKYTSGNTYRMFPFETSGTFIFEKNNYYSVCSASNWFIDIDDYHQDFTMEYQDGYYLQSITKSQYPTGIYTGLIDQSNIYDSDGNLVVEYDALTDLSQGCFGINKLSRGIYIISFGQQCLLFQNGTKYTGKTYEEAKDIGMYESYCRNYRLRYFKNINQLKPKIIELVEKIGG